MVYYPTKNSDGRGVGRLEEVRLDGTRKMRLTAFGHVVGESEATPVAAGQKLLGHASTAATLGSQAKGSTLEWVPGKTLPTPASAAALAAKEKAADPGPRKRAPDPQGSDPQVMAVKKAVLEAASALQEGSHRARPGGKAAVRAARSSVPPSRKERITKPTDGNSSAARGKAKAEDAGNTPGEPAAKADANGVGNVPEDPATGAAKASTEALQQGRAGTPGKEETVWTGFRETYRRRAKSDGLTPEKEASDARGTKRKAPPGSHEGRNRKAGNPQRFQRARSESDRECEDENEGEEWSKEEVLQAIRDATELKYEKKIDWSDVPGCRQYSLTKKEYSARIKSLNRRAPGRRAPSEAGVGEVMGNWSVALRELGMKRHGIGALV